MGGVKLKIKKDDFVGIISGKDRGKRGKVLKVFPAEQRVIVEKVNMVLLKERARFMSRIQCLSVPAAINQ